MQVYSNAFVHEETGDLLGYDLAVKREAGSGVDALLYVYEGGEGTRRTLLLVFVQSAKKLRNIKRETLFYL